MEDGHPKRNLMNILKHNKKPWGCRFKMPNTLLEDIKTLDYTHEEALKILKDKKEADKKSIEDKKKLDEQAEKDKLIQKEKDKNKDKDKDKDVDKVLDIDIAKLSADITKAVSSTVSASVSEEIKKQIGLLRGSAPTGDKGDAPIDNDFFVKKNLFEVIV